MTIRLAWAFMVIALAPATAWPASEWTHYVNSRFGYEIDIPPGFSPVAEAMNSDGGVSASADGHAELAIWGSYLVIGDFADDIARRMETDISDGWTITYDRHTATKASWSGSRGDRIVYTRAIKACDESAVYFRIEYDRDDLSKFNPVIDRLVKSLVGC